MENYSDLFTIQNFKEKQTDYQDSDNEDIKPLPKTRMDKLLLKHSDRFQLEGDDLTATNITKHRILTINDYPVNTKQYRLPHALREEVDKQIRELLEKGVIRPSKSAYNHRGETQWKITGNKHGGKSMRSPTFAWSLSALPLPSCPFARINSKMKFLYI